MPYPEPFALGTIIVMIFAVITSTCHNLFRKKASPSEKNSPAPEKIETTFDPFADPPLPVSSNRSPTHITVEYVEVYSGTEELTFDWITSPFQQDSDPKPSVPPK